MIDETSALSGFLSQSSGGSRTSLDQDAFMQLLVTQLRNQDPLSPLQPHEFAAQLAEFSGVEQLGQIKNGIAQQLESLQLAMVMNETSFSASLVGKDILAVGDQVAVTEGARGEVQIKVEVPGGDGKLVIKDADGSIVDTVEVGYLAAGRQTVQLPEDLEAGVYTYEIEVTDDNGDKVPLTQYVSGQVGQVVFEGGQIVLRLGGIDVSLSALVEIGSPSTNG